ncbi:MAG: transcriptional regulator [Alphaproteobacteria bacterium]|nr:MAG: transcriptional regulator [Alphaproteobacteria bacterium]
MKKISPIDTIIARNIKNARARRSLSLKYVSAKMGIAYQQLQKYESASNRISAGRLWELSQIYKTPVKDFFTPKTI